MKKHLRTILWLLVAVLALAFVVWRTDKETFLKTISNIHWGWAWSAVLAQCVAQTLLATRWVLLLKVQGISIPVFQAIKLTYLGLFYNNMMPGAVGGDVLKGWYVTRHCPTHLRLEAAVTVFVDRVVGLIGIVLVGAIASLFVGPELAYEGIQIRWIGWAFFVAMCLAGAIFLSHRIRRFLRLGVLIDRLPFKDKLQKIDEAMQMYRHHKLTIVLALLMTSFMQGLAIVAFFLIAKSLQLHTVTLLQCVTVTPIIWVVGAAIPVPGGLGIIEGTVTYLYSVVINPADPASAIGQAAAMALLVRLLLAVSSLPGALVPLFGGHLPKQKELQHMAEVMEQEEEQNQQEQNQQAGQSQPCPEESKPSAEEN